MQLIHEEESALEHLLMEEHTSTSLCCHHEEHRQEVWGKSWPWGIGKRHDGAINKGIYDIVLLFRNQEVIALYLHPHTQSAESLRNDSQVLRTDRSLMRTPAPHMAAIPMNEPTSIISGRMRCSAP